MRGSYLHLICSLLVGGSRHLQYEVIFIVGRVSAYEDMGELSDKTDERVRGRRVLLAPPMSPLFILSLDPFHLPNNYYGDHTVVGVEL